jgi:hypothetical protein
MIHSTSLEQFFERNPDWRPYADLVVVPPTAEEAQEEWPELDGSELLDTENWMTSYGVTRLALYVKMRRTGQGHRFAEMIAAQKSPACMTDDVFFAGMPRLAEQMPPRQLQNVLASAKRHGFTPSADAVYHSGLARFQGDPEAFVTRSMGRTYIKRLCEQRGWACEGGVKVAARQPENDPLDKKNCVPMAEDLIRSNARKMIRQNPDLAHLPKQKLREKVLQKYGPSS